MSPEAAVWRDGRASKGIRKRAAGLKRRLSNCISRSRITDFKPPWPGISLNHRHILEEVSIAESGTQCAGLAILPLLGFACA